MAGGQRQIERQVTHAAHGHVLTNAAVWSPDSRWIVYDVRPDPHGAEFTGPRIERVDVETGRVELLYESREGACCGVVTASPVDDRVVFILGPERPTPDWEYGPAHRQGVIVRTSRPGVAEPLDARDLVPPFTPGALRGGSHVHTFSPDGRLVAFTYDDAVCPGHGRTVGVCVCDRPVTVPRAHPRNHDGSGFSVIAARVAETPRPGTPEISRAFEESWIGTDGYVKPGGVRQRRALAFQGHVAVPAPGGDTAVVTEAFVCDLPDDPAVLAVAGDEPLAGGPTTSPAPPAGVTQRRITSTVHRRFPGIQGPRHWLRSSPDGARIAMLMRDDDGRPQIFAVSPWGGAALQVTRGVHGVESAFTWSPDGGRIAHVAGGAVCVTDPVGGESLVVAGPVGTGGRVTPPRPEACVFSPDGRRIAIVRGVAEGGGGAVFNQIFVVEVPT
jgi:hypothetical protein